MKRPAIDLGTCILCEICVELAPNAFEISDSGFVQVLPLDNYMDDDIHEAMKNCPKDCITWEEV
ncbi:MAG: ferredoxin [Desulfotignum sp.]|nr:ferredoxin [Desulfobacteraceae bacterium]